MVQSAEVETTISARDITNEGTFDLHNKTKSSLQLGPVIFG